MAIIIYYVFRGRKFDIELEVPLQCLKVHINLFELEKPATEEIRQAAYNGKMEPIGDCWFTNVMKNFCWIIRFLNNCQNSKNAR